MGKRLNIKRFFKQRLCNDVLPNEQVKASLGEPVTIKSRKEIQQKRRFYSVTYLVLIVTIIFLFLRLIQDNNAKLTIDEGLLTVKGYAFEGEDIEEIELKSGIRLPREANWTMATNIVPGLPLELSYPNDQAMFSIRVSDGVLRSSINGKTQFVGQEIELPNKSTIYWNNIDFNENNESNLILNITCFVEVIIRVEEHIVGYAVIKIFPVTEFEQGHVFSAMMLKSVTFPKIEGANQKIILDYIESEMLKLEQNSFDNLVN